MTILPTYAQAAYAMLIAILLYACYPVYRTKPILAKAWQVMLWAWALVLGSTPLIAGLSITDYLNSFFGEPALLSLLIFGQWLLPPDKRLTKKARLWLLFGSVLVVMSATALIGVDFYHQAVPIHALIALGILMPAFWWDKKTLGLMWLILLAWAGSIMTSNHLLDYLADFWLFVYALVSFVGQALLTIKATIKAKLAKTTNANDNQRQ